MPDFKEKISDTIYYQLPEAGRVLVVSPHPDDEVIGCGGSIALYKQRSAEVRIVMLTNGEHINLEGYVNSENFDVLDMRKKEAENASASLDVDVTFLGYPDGNVTSCQGEIQNDLARIVEEMNPEIVFVPSVIEQHPDHRSSARIVLNLMNAADFQIAMYEVSSPLRYNTLVDITAVLDMKKKALLQYHYSTYTMPGLFWDAVKGLNYSRSMHVVKNGYYEAFMVCDRRPSRKAILEWLTYGSESR